MTQRMRLAAVLSLGFLWVFSGITSVFFAKDIGLEVLARAGVTGSQANLYIALGSALDVVIGVWLLTGWRLRLCCLLQMGVIAVYTLLLTAIEPSLWLHPFGPLTKNIPVLILVYCLYSERRIGSLDAANQNRP